MSSHPLDRDVPLEESIEALHAIRRGEVDALVVHSGDTECIYTLRQIEPPYRALIEQMNEGVVVLSAEGLITYVNQAFVTMIGREDAIGRTIQDVFGPGELASLESGSRCEIRVGERDVCVSARDMPHETGPVRGLVFADVTVPTQRARQIVNLTRDLTLAEQRERERLAHTLHDHLQQLIVAVRIQLTRVREGAGADVLDDAFRLLNEAQKACRELSVDLSPPMLHNGDMASTLQWLASQIQDKHRLDVQLECAAEMTDLPEATRVLLFLAARELLFNVVKHSGASSAKLRLSRDDGRFTLEVTDGGKGFSGDLSGNGSGGFGLANLRERAQHMGGELLIEPVQAPASGKGTRVRLWVPNAS